VDYDAYTSDSSSGSFIARDFVHGNGFEHGLQCIIDPDVVVGDDVRLGHRVHLASGTRVLNDVEIADDCVTTGVALLGNHVRVRTGSCISKSVVIDDWCFVAAGIMSSHTKNVDHGRPHAPKRQLITRFGYGSIIGSRTNTSAGVTVAPGSTVGYGSAVVFDLETPHGIYYNSPNPWATLQSVLQPDNPFYIEIPADYVPHEFDGELLRKYLPHARP
jgi:acetyltransferase-like isoleucine patch superfamily enzyme